MNNLEPDTTVAAELHYTQFECADAFEALARRHGLAFAGIIDDVPTTPFWWAKGLGTDEQLSLRTEMDPTAEQEKTYIVADPKNAGATREARLVTGYASYIYVHGPVYAAEPLYRDIIETAEYIKGEFCPLSTIEPDEAKRTIVLSGRDIGIPKVPSSDGTSSDNSDRESAPHQSPHPDGSWPRYQDAPVCDECESREAMRPTSVADGSVTEWACFACSKPKEIVRGQEERR